MVKILGVILLLAGTTGYGLYKGCVYSEGLENLYEIKKAFLYIQGEIRYMNTPMPEVLEHAAAQSRGRCRAFFKRAAEGLLAGSGKELREVWEEAAARELGEGALEREALSALRGMGGQLGCLDRKAQERTIEYFLLTWDGLIERRQREKSEKLKLYYVCGIMGGLLMVIILV